MRLLLVEDDAVIRHELLLRWQTKHWVVVACGDLASAQRAWLTEHAAEPFDVLVLDLGLPDGDGLVWLGELRLRGRPVPAIALTARDRVADRVLGLNSGADDYLVKPFDPDELDARIEALQRRGEVSLGEVRRFGRIRWVRGEGCAFVDDKPLDLMPREFEVLGMLMERAPRLLPKRVLIDRLAERNLEVGDSAAEVYVSRLRRKLVGTGATIRTMRGFGYVLEDAEKDVRL